MKSSNPKVMIECYRLLAARLAKLGSDWNYPLHLGVTEAGDGEDGRIKSAIGIGSLLCDGLGDTIRVSLTEDSPNEIAVCNDLLAQIPELTDPDADDTERAVGLRPVRLCTRRATPEIELADGIKCGGEQTIRVVVTQAAWDKLATRIQPGDDVKPEAVYEELNVMEVDPCEAFSINCDTQLVTVKDDHRPARHHRVPPAGRTAQGAWSHESHFAEGLPPLRRHTARAEHRPAPRRRRDRLAAVRRHWGCTILIRGESGAGQSLRLAYNILQAAGCRSFKTDFVACPSCGRTLFDSAGSHRPNQGAHRAPQGRENRHYGMHRERPG